MRITRGRFAGLAASLVIMAGCGGGDSEPVCEPSCPVGTHCTLNGCEPDSPGGGVQDLAVPFDDIRSNGGCSTPCTGATPHCSPSRVCVPCLMDAHCPTGRICKVSAGGASCVPGCADDSRCGAPGGPVKCCNGSCTDTSKDGANCGACGMACMGGHANASCSNGQCALGACTPGWGDCNQSSADGCETGLRTDPANCGACGMACAIANAISGCANGCYIAACKFGFDDCNANEKDGCEASVLSDVKNCGACGKPCALVPHAKNTCLNGACQLTSCDAGWTDCDGNAVNGCEIGIGTDAKNCGSCGMACGQNQVCINGACTCPMCVIANARTKCVNNQCTFDACLPGYADCNNSVNDGCEKDIGNDAMNCGSCGVACGGNTPFCSGGQCVAQPPGCFRVGDVQQVGPMKDQYTSCDQVMNGGFTCVNPTIRYGNVPGGVPAKHANNDYLAWCKQVGCNGYVANSVAFGQRSYAAPAGKLFWCSGYDEPAWKWCDWQDGTWYNQRLDYHPQLDMEAITSITCN